MSNTYKTITVPVIWNGWCLTLREEQELQEFENEVPRKIFCPKKDEEREKFKA
jgi:hypothetical protein